VWLCRFFFSVLILALLALQFSVSSQVAAMNDRVFEMFGGQQVFCDRCISSCFLLGAGVQCEWLQRSDGAGWSFALSAVASTSIGSIIPFALKNIMMTVFRGGSLAVRSCPSFDVACCGSQDSAAVRPVVPNVQVLHSNLASVKLDAAALRIIKAAYAFVALQGEAVNKTILIQTEKQRLRIKSAGVAPETLQGPGAMHARRWWVYDSKAAAKQRVVLLPVGRAEPSAAYRWVRRLLTCHIS